ncbi:MAG: ribosome maturation factor RimM [Tissierellia bacterium]|nr:ribosome maturation factor RimM [Tissierellia bacterium]
MKSDEFVLLGAIVKPHGIKGEVKVIPIDTDVLRFQNLNEIYIGSEKQSISVEGFKNSGKFAILKLKEIDNIEDAMALTEKEIYSTISNRPTLDDGKFYISDLISLKVKDLYTKKTGLVANVETYPANDVLVCKFENSIAKIPMIKEFIKEIDLEDGLIIVETIDGMIL